MLLTVAIFFLLAFILIVLVVTFVGLRSENWWR